MPPKSLKKMLRDLKPKGGFGLAWGNALGGESKLAALAMRLIETQSLIELRIEGMLATLLKAEFHTVITMLHSIESAAVRKVAIKAAAEKALSPDDFRLLVATLKFGSATERRRHQFAHYIWAVCPEIPNHLVLIDPKDIKDENARFLEHNTGKGPNDKKYAAPGRKFYDEARVFSESDLQEDLDRALQLDQVIFRLSMLIEDPNGPQAAAIRQQLLVEPQIAHMFHKQSTQTNTQAQP